MIAAYLPNEAATIVETVEAFRAVDYPGDLQIIVAYNTPTPMSVEDDLRAVARSDPRVVPLKVEGSTSKAQNVNAALSHVRRRVRRHVRRRPPPGPGRVHARRGAGWPTGTTSSRATA